MRVAAVFALAFLLAGCGPGRESSGPAPAPSYSGTVIELADGRFLVRGEGDSCGIWVAAEPDAEVLRGTTAAAWDDIRAGDRVDVWIPGPIAESCPMQGSAARVVIRAG